MTKFCKLRGFFDIQPDSGYPKYFGYNTKFRGISEPITDANKLDEIRLGRFINVFLGDKL